MCLWFLSRPNGLLENWTARTAQLVWAASTSLTAVSVPAAGTPPSISTKAAWTVTTNITSSSSSRGGRGPGMSWLVCWQMDLRTKGRGLNWTGLHWRVCSSTVLLSCPTAALPRPLTHWPTEKTPIRFRSARCTASLTGDGAVQKMTPPSGRLVFAPQAL